MHPEQGLLTVYIVVLAIIVIAILVAGISLIEETRSFLPRLTIESP
jgi:flagellar biosynthesis protein FliQ